MKISDFVQKHKDELGVTCCSIYRLIKNNALKENIHYRKSCRMSYEKYSVLEIPLINYLKGRK